MNTIKNNDINKSLSLCIAYAGICGCIIGFVLFGFSEKISISWIKNSQTSFPLKVLSLSLPFVAMSSALGGYFTAIDCIPHYSAVQLLEQGFKIILTVQLLRTVKTLNPFYSCVCIVAGITASEILSFCLSSVLRKIKKLYNQSGKTVKLSKILRIAIPDALGSCTRSVLLTAEHLLIPAGLKKSGYNYSSAISAYGIIHGMSLPVLLYPSAVLSSLSALLIPEFARLYEIGDKQAIRKSALRNLKRTIVYSFICSAVFFLFSEPISVLFYKSNEASKYIKILSPLVPVMYTDTVTDGMLKGLDQQVYSMSFNIVDSALCVILVLLVLPKYSVKGYIFILYFSEIINFILSTSRLAKICNVRYFQVHEEENSTFFRLKKC